MAGGGRSPWERILGLDLVLPHATAPSPKSAVSGLPARTASCKTRGPGVGAARRLQLTGRPPPPTTLGRPTSAGSLGADRPYRVGPAVSDAPAVSLDRNGLEILTRKECLELLATREVGRVGLVANALPAILAVNYRMLGEDIVFATGTGSKSLSASHNSVIAFEVDYVRESDRSGWSVLAVGEAVEITERDADWSDAQLLDLHPWASRYADQLIRVPTKRLSGRRLTGPVGRRARD